MKYFKYFIYLLVVGILVYFLVNLINKPGEEEDEQDNNIEETEDEENIIEDDEEEEEEEDDNADVDFSDFSEESQEVGDEESESEYTLLEINDEIMSDFHRFTFVFDSEDVPYIQASLDSSGGYIRVRLNNVTSDQSGIAYNSSRDINEQGITRLYHTVTAVESEEVYDIGITKDTIFFLHEDGANAILDVKYPGEVEAGDYNDPEDFTTEDIELEGTNTEGDARIVGFTWGVEGGAVKFIWKTSSSSGNPTPATIVNRYEDAIAVRFSDVMSDSILGADESFEMELASPVVRVVGQVDGDDHIYTFQVQDAEYKIYRESSPNQVVIEIR